MAHTIVISNLKGGTGKTTSAINIAACLAAREKRTLLLDLDQQGNTSQNLGMAESDFTISNILINEERVRAFQVRENLVLIPCDRRFSRFETEAKDKLRREELLKKALEPIKSKCDFIIIDAPPALGLTTVNAFTCADHVIIPLEAQQFGIDAFKEVMKLLTAIKEQLNPTLDLLGILFTRHRKNVILNKDIYRAMSDDFPGKTFETVIRENVALREAPHQNKTIIDYNPDSNGGKDYMKLTEEILNRLGYETE